MTGLFFRPVDLVEQSRRNEHCLQSRPGGRECFLLQSSSKLLMKFNKPGRSKDSHLLSAEIQWVLSNMTFGIRAAITFKASVSCCFGPNKQQVTDRNRPESTVSIRPAARMVE